MSDVAVVTANFGGYDEPRGAVLQEGYEDADWFYFVDEEVPVGPDPWRYRAGFRWSDNPRLDAKRFKLTPWNWLPEDRYRWIVWLDSNMEVTNPRFLWEALASAACIGAPVTAMAHPRRSTVAAEVTGSFEEAPQKYGAMRPELERQIGDYHAAGFPDDRGLWACGTLVWNTEHRDWKDLGYFWLTECETHTIQDQVSLPFVAWQMWVEVGTFPVPQLERRADGGFGNRWIRIWPHNRED